MYYCQFWFFIFQARVVTFVGVGDSYYSNLVSLLAFTSSLFKNEIYSDVLEINDTEIFGVNVRIYRHMNKTNQDKKDGKQDLLPAMIYFHGGGWTFGSLGKSLFNKNIGKPWTGSVLSIAQVKIQPFIVIGRDLTQLSQNGF